MRSSSALRFLPAVGVASAAAVMKRQSTGGLDDPTILNFALTLEHLEATFYSDGMKNYSDSDFNSAGFPNIRSKIQQIADDESQHVSFITSALQAAGVTPVGASTYVFPSHDVKSFLGLAQILEGVGVAAYLGAAPYITNKQYLGAAGSILTVEARHNAFIRYTNGQSPFPGPEDAALSPKSIVTIAAGLFAPGAQNAPAITPFPALAVTASNPNVGQSVTATASNITASPVYCAFVSGLTIGFSSWANNACQIPTQNVTAGQTYVLLTSAQTLSDNTTLAGPAIIDVGDAPSTSSNASSAPGSTSNSGSSSSSSSSKSGAASFAPLSLAAVGSALLGAVALL